MQLEQLVCDLEYAKRVKELRIKQESLFYWYKSFTNPFVDYHEQGCIHQDYPSPEKLYSAFTAPELAELVPAIINGAPLEILKVYNINMIKPKYYARYFNADIFTALHETMADAMAELLVHLLENNFVKAEDLK